MKIINYFVKKVIYTLIVRQWKICILDGGNFPYLDIEAKKSTINLKSDSPNIYLTVCF